LKLEGPQMKRLVTLISDSLERTTFERLVTFELSANAEDIVGDGATKIDAVFKVVQWSLKRDRLSLLLEGVMRENPTVTTEVRTIIAEATRTEAVGPVGPCAATAWLPKRPAVAAPGAAPPDPLAPYFPQDQPFVNRKELADKLQLLWAGGNSGVLVVRGERYSGRTHSWWRIVEASAANGVATCLINISRNPGAWTVRDLILRVDSHLRIDQQTLKDSLAQSSTQAGALVSALIAHFRVRSYAGETRCCLVLDGFDRTGVDRALIELVEDLIIEVLAGNLPGLSLIILGYGDHTEQTITQRVLNEKIDWLDGTHLQDWLRGVVAAAGKVAGPADIATTSQNILSGLAPPFNAASMTELNSRVKKQAIELLRRLP
jgi:hypothetical protein